MALSQVDSVIDDGRAVSRQIMALASRQGSSRRATSNRRSRPSRRSSKMGTPGLVLLLLLAVLFVADRQFDWGLFPDDSASDSTAVPTRAAGAGEPEGLPVSAERAEVVRVSDGDSVRVEIRGAEYAVRLIGIDTPETYVTRTGYRECWGQEASDFAKDALVPGSIVYMQTEPEGDDVDQYDRLLRYIWVDAGAAGVGEPGEAVMFNEVLVLQGYAIAYPYDPDATQNLRFAAAEDIAEDAGLGIWCACGGERIPEDETRTGCPIPDARAA